VILVQLLASQQIHRPKVNLPLKVEVERAEEVVEYCETLTEVFQTLISDLGAAVNKSTKSSYKSHLLLKVEVDGF